MKSEQLTIRVIDYEDIPAILRIMLDNWDGVMSEYHSPEIVAKFRGEVSGDWMKRQMGWKRIFVVEKDSNVVATGALADFGKPGNTKLCISQFFVHPDLHGRGIGKLLMKHLLDMAAKGGIKQIHVPSSRNAVLFYKSIGFTVDSEQTDIADEITWMSMNM